MKRVVFAASSSAYGDTPTLPKIETMTPQPLSPYAVSKLTGEHLMTVFASLYGIETLSLRYFNVFGPRQDPTSQYAAVIPNFITAALTGKTRPASSATASRRATSASSRTSCARTSSPRRRRTSSRARSSTSRAASASRSTSSSRIIGEEAGKKLEAEYGPTRAGDVRDSLASIDAARELIGYEPKVKVREGLKRTVAAFKS